MQAHRPGGLWVLKVCEDWEAGAATRPTPPLPLLLLLNLYMRARCRPAVSAPLCFSCSALAPALLSACTPAPASGADAAPEGLPSGSRLPAPPPLLPGLGSRGRRASPKLEEARFRVWMPQSSVPPACEPRSLCSRSCVCWQARASIVRFLIVCLSRRSRLGVVLVWPLGMRRTIVGKKPRQAHCHC